MRTSEIGSNAALGAMAEATQDWRHEVSVAAAETMGRAGMHVPYRFYPPQSRRTSLPNALAFYHRNAFCSQCRSFTCGMLHNEIAGRILASVTWLAWSFIVYLGGRASIGDRK